MGYFFDVPVPEDIEKPLIELLWSREIVGIPDKNPPEIAKIGWSSVKAWRLFGDINDKSGDDQDIKYDTMLNTINIV